MKKQMSLFVWAVALFGMSPVLAAPNGGTRAASSADLTGMPATRTRENVNYQKYETRTMNRTYNAGDGKNIYYTAPRNRSALYKDYDATRTSSTMTTTQTTVRTSRAETVRREMKRKYYLAHPFFQPLQGKFGSVTDFSYLTNSYKFNIHQTVPDAVSNKLLLDGLNAKWNMDQFSIQEDFSYGITDTIALMAMLRYDFSEYKFKWDDPLIPNDKDDNNDLNLYGIGARWRFVDNDKWIANVSGYFQHQKDIANNFILELKGGYKVGSSTIYGLARGWYVNFDGNTYGNAVENKDKNNYAMTYIAYQTNIDDNIFYAEGGAGVFTVLDEDWTLNLEGVFGYYDWHNQASVRGAIGWQPNDWFALNLYAKTAFYDSANDKHLSLYFMEPAVGFNSLTDIGSVKLKDYAETSVGLQAIFYF